MQNILFKEYSLRTWEFGKGILEWLRFVFWPFVKKWGLRLLRFLAPRWKRYLLRGALAGGGFILIFFSITYFSYRSNKQEISERLKLEKEWLYGRGVSRKKPLIKIYDRNRRLIGEYLPERGSHITMQVCKQMKWLPKAAVSSEDRDFYKHAGISYKGIFRAMINNLRTLSLREGGGTITQQLARNLFTGRQRTFTRKLKESFIAKLIEEKFTKDEILCLYLNKIYMGEGRIGAEEASWFYFEKPPLKLTAAEAAMVVGLFPSPVRYSPLNNIKLSLKKQKSVLLAMARDGHLKKKDVLFLQQRFIKKYGVSLRGEPSSGRIAEFGASRDFRYNVAPTANAYVKHYLYENLDEEEIQKGGLSVFTTIDKDRQLAALQSVRRAVALLRRELVKKSKRLPPEKARRYAKRINGVLVSVDPQTGEILAVVGGYGVSEGKMYHRPFFMRRQPGSSLKGFLYAVAMDEGILDVNSIVEDKRFRKGRWSPRNWNGRYLGPIPLRQALAISSNSVAVRTLADLGAGVYRRRLMSAIGEEDSSRFPTNLTLALGSAELTPLEVARIYALINNGGFVVETHLVDSVRKNDGDYLIPPSEELHIGPQLLSEEACQKAVKLMTYVFDPELKGTARHIGKRRLQNPNYLPFDIAGKTGTVQVVRAVRRKFPGVAGHQKDAWFVGLVPGETTVVWLGQDEGAPITRGSALAASVWADYAQSALRGKIEGNFAEVEIIDPEPETEGEDSLWDDLFGEDKKEKAKEDANEDAKKDTKEAIKEESKQDSNPESPAGPSTKSSETKTEEKPSLPNADSKEPQKQEQKTEEGKQPAAQTQTNPQNTSSNTAAANPTQKGAENPTKNGKIQTTQKPKTDLPKNNTESKLPFS